MDNPIEASLGRARRATGEARRANKLDVAQLAGVSHQTVSRVVNGSTAVAEETRIRVEAAIKALHYRPNRSARSLATQRSDAIGVLSLRQPGHGFMDAILAGVGDAARTAGYGVGFADLDVEPADAGASDRIHAALDRFLSEDVDGVLVVSPFDGTAATLGAYPDELPTVVMFGTGPASAGEASIDNALGGRLVAQHLLGLGHTRIAMIAGPENRLDSTGRLEGLRTVLATAGLPLLDLARGDWTADSGYWATTELMERSRPTAIFCANDQMALGAIHRLSDHGVRVPEDVSIVGYDDIAESAHFLPPLTTVRQDFREVGARAFEELHLAISGEGMTPVVLAPELVVRSSTRGG